MEERKIKDIIKEGSDEDIQKSLDKKITDLWDYCELVKKKFKRTNKNLVCFNILSKTILYLKMLRYFLNSPAEFYAFITRNLFELNLITKYILINDSNLNGFIAQAYSDKRRIFEDLLKLETEDSDKVIIEVLKGAIKDIQTQMDNHNLLEEKPYNVSELAKKVDDNNDYKVFYKLFSKYSHPSSFVINVPSEEVERYKNIFLIYSQIYSGEIYKRIKDELG